MFEAYESPWMDEELKIMRDAVQKFLVKEFVPHSERWEKQGIVDRDAWKVAGDAGILLRLDSGRVRWRRRQL